MSNPFKNIKFEDTEKICMHQNRLPHENHELVHVLVKMQIVWCIANWGNLVNYLLGNNNKCHSKMGI